MLLRLFLIAGFLWWIDPATACSPLPAGIARTVQPIRAAETHALIEIVALETARFPQTARVRVRGVRWGPYRAGQILRVQPSSGASCGPDEITAGSRGFMVIRQVPRTAGPLGFNGYADPATLPR